MLSKVLDIMLFYQSDVICSRSEISNNYISNNNTYYKLNKTKNYNILWHYLIMHLFYLNHVHICIKNLI